jgi:hypothetical protein
VNSAYKQKGMLVIRDTALTPGRIAEVPMLLAKERRGWTQTINSLVKPTRARD